MAAVSTLIDRIYRDFLNKPDDLSAFSRLDENNPASYTTDVLVVLLIAPSKRENAERSSGLFKKSL